ncbi:hypothetical protein [Kitasatospora sp. NPDC017646]|uniref:hypothetical protein n=1 Tax=Kitasatospora sp. NPDC017646 TaxID=3364024 RepID=UPI0037B47E90
MRQPVHHPAECRAVGVPLDPRIGDDDLRFRLADGGADLVITDRARLTRARRVSALFLGRPEETAVPTLHLCPGDVPGDHYSMLGEHVATAAEAIRTWLAPR